jgi:type IV fimbrial biogenesis protein FimT
MSLIDRRFSESKLFNGLGFTLIELMITVAIVSILAGIAVPSFREMLRQNRATSLANELATSLNLARSEAIKRGTVVSVCKSGNVTNASPTCSTTANWQDGWLIFVDKGTAGTFDAVSDTRLKIGQPSSNSAVITGDTTFADYIAYHPSGMSKGSGLPNGSFHICADGVKRKLTISATGRIRFIKETC